MIGFREETSGNPSTLSSVVAPGSAKRDTTLMPMHNFGESSTPYTAWPTAVDISGAFSLNAMTLKLFASMANKQPNDWIRFPL